MAKYLYKIWQTVNNGYDTYDSAVVCAESEEQAQNTDIGGSYTWTTPEFVQVKRIGKADKDTELGIIVASFNAG